MKSPHQALRPSVLKIPDACKQSLASLEGTSNNRFCSSFPRKRE